MTEDIELTDEEKELLKQLTDNSPYPKAEDKVGIFQFFNNILASNDTTKTGFLTGDELGFTRIPVRTNQELSNYCDKMGSSGLGSYFLSKGEITLATSLSREGFLDKLAVTSTKQVESISKIKAKENKGWFSRKNKKEDMLV